MKSARSSGQSGQPAHVVKRIAPTQPGAIKLARQFGDRLVCVRYRHDRSDTYRYTTVELIVDEAPIKMRSTRSPPKIQLVAVRIEPGEAELMRALRTHGAVWDGKARLWYVRRPVAKVLGLHKRIV